MRLLVILSYAVIIVFIIALLVLIFYTVKALKVYIKKTTTNNKLPTTRDKS